MPLFFLDSTKKVSPQRPRFFHGPLEKIKIALHWEAMLSGWIRLLSPSQVDIANHR